MDKSSSKKSGTSPPFDPMQCPSCGSSDVQMGQTVSVGKIKKISESAWQADGKVKLVRCLHGLCRNCGLVFDAIKQDIPVQFSSLRCPTCDKAKDLKGEILELEQTGEAYKFVAVFTCAHCGKRKAVKKVLKYLWSIVRVKVSLTGVELELDKDKRI